MEIKQKGASAEIESLKQLVAKMTWNSQADFDLAALYEGKDGKKGLVFFQDKGSLDAHPFMKLSGDAGVGDTVDSGGNEEILKITKLDDVAKVHIVVWDWGALQNGQPARFNDSDVKLELIDNKGNANSVSLDTGETGNVLVLATIDNTDPMGAKLINESKPGTLKGLTDSAQLWAIAA